MSQPDPVLRLRAGRDESVRRCHPWVFSGSLEKTPPGPSLDGPLRLLDRNTTLGWAFTSPNSPLAARVWSFLEEPPDKAFVKELVRSALILRQRVVPPETDGYRVIHAEGDFLPGLIVDRYGSVLAVQATTEGTERARPYWLPALFEFFPDTVVVQKNDLASRAGEGLNVEDEVLRGDALPPRVEFRERGLNFVADVFSGQKTGFFLDQRENRHLIRQNSAGKRVLNLFAYSGAFGVAALAGGASYVEQVDIAPAALELARENHRINGQPVEGDAKAVDFIAADVFDDLRVRTTLAQKWDVVVTDPPAFAKRKTDLERACRGYKDINRLAIKLLPPGGLLLACSCSGPISADLFQKVLFAAALDAGARIQILEERGAGPDHPVSVYCPEGRYLKAFLLRRV
jgi:23S rRNA (cytosine1962-C5)-methyltransferase